MFCASKTRSLWNCSLYSQTKTMQHSNFCYIVLLGGLLRICQTTRAFKNLKKEILLATLKVIRPEDKLSDLCLRMQWAILPRFDFNQIKKIVLHLFTLDLCCIMCFEQLNCFYFGRLFLDKDLRHILSLVIISVLF